MNEKGSSLILVLIVSLIFTILGLSIIAATVNNVKRTEIRELEVSTTITGKRLMSETLANLQNNLIPGKGAPHLQIYTEEIKKILLEKDSPKGTDYNLFLSQLITETENSINSTPGIEGKVKIIDLSDFDHISAEEKEEFKKYINVPEDKIEKFKEDNFTRIFKIEVEYSSSETNNPTIKRTLIQNVILSPTPSFFNYALGAYGKEIDSDADISNNALVINGSPDIIGSVFAPNIQTNAEASYELSSGGGSTQPFDGPSIYGTLFINDADLNVDFFKGSYKEVVEDQLISGVPTIKPTGNDDYFIDMNFNETFNRKVKDTIGFDRIEDVTDTTLKKMCSSDINSDDYYFTALQKLGFFNSPDSTDEIISPDPGTRESDLYQQYNSIVTSNINSPIKCTNSTKEIYLLEKDFMDQQPFSYGADDILYYTDIETKNGGTDFDINKSTLVLDDDLELGDGWLIVNGNLKIITGTDENLNSPVEIEGNILVTGDFIVEGKCDTTTGETCDYNNMIKFNSTVYAQGRGIIYNTNISGLDDGGLVLMSKGNLSMAKDALLITRINEFKSAGSEKESLINKINGTPDLKAFFYTENEATLYGVGSKMIIEGGIFARKSLTINAIRGDASLDSLSSSGRKDPEYRSSRFFVEYDPKVVTDQLNALPRIDRLQMIPDSLFIK